MNKESILKSDLLDIVFENRNKSYGAYTLRKFYSNRLVKSLALALGGALVLSAFTLLPKKHVKADIDKEYTTDIFTIADPKKDEPKKDEPKPKEQPKTPPAPSQAFNTPEVTKDPITPPIKDLGDSITIAKKDDPGTPGIPGTIIPPTDPPTVGGGGGITDTPEPGIDTKTPIPFAEVMPSFPGGTEALQKFLQKNLNSPDEIEEGKEVSVKVRFVVNYDGKLQSMTVVEDGGDIFNKEVLRVIKKMPDWVPGKTKGQNVSVYYTIPVKFRPDGQ
jgi:protein TonB